MNIITRRTMLQGIAAACIAWATPAFARDDDWDLIGNAKFKDEADQKDIAVSAIKGTFRSIKFKARNADAKIDGMIIELANGDKVDKQIRDTVKKDQETRPIAIKLDRGMVVRKITIKARSDEDGKETTIEAYGTK
ncbi:MAG TPA: hypothetical protein VGI81_20100 [Tepidisphaeraceae bacterium]|jgi:hypothetical protein